MTPVERLDEILKAVCGRHTVYAHEILHPLSERLHEATGAEFDLYLHTHSVLRSAVGTVGDESYLHYRDFLDPLLDLRNTLKEAT